MKKQLPLLPVLLIYLFFAKQIFAASITMQNTPSQIGVSDEYTVDVNLSINASDGTTYYLRGAFYQPGSQYCGFTWNGSSWFSGPYSSNNGWQNFLPVMVHNNSWTGQVKAKIDATDSNCMNTGQYSFKIERFTNSGSSSFDTQTEQTVTVVIPTPTPTPTDIPTPTLTPKPPSATPTLRPTSTPIPTPTLKPTLKVPSATPTEDPQNMEGADDHAVLADAITPTDIPTISQGPTTAVLGASAGSNVKAIIFYSLGGILFVICGILLFRQYRLSQSNEPTDN